MVVTPFAPADDANVSNNAIPRIELTPIRRRTVVTSLVTRLPMSRPTSKDGSAIAEATEVPHLPGEVGYPSGSIPCDEVGMLKYKKHDSILDHLTWCVIEGPRAH